MDFLFRVEVKTERRDESKPPFSVVLGLVGSATIRQEDVDEAPDLYKGATVGQTSYFMEGKEITLPVTEDLFNKLAVGSVVGLYVGSFQEPGEVEID